MNEVLARFADLSAIESLLLRATLLLAGAWLVHALLRWSNPRWRMLLWRAAMVGLLLLPLADASLPRFEIGIEIPAPPAETPPPVQEAAVDVPAPVRDAEPFDAFAFALAEPDPEWNGTKIRRFSVELVLFCGASGFVGGFQIGLSLATMNILSMGARASCPRIRVVAGETPALPYHVRKRGVGRRQPKL